MSVDIDKSNCECDREMPSRPIATLRSSQLPENFSLSYAAHDAQVLGSGDDDEQFDDEYDDEAMEVPHSVAVAEDEANNIVERNEEEKEKDDDANYDIEEYEFVQWKDVINNEPTRSRGFCFLCDMEDGIDDEIGITEKIKHLLYSEYFTNPVTVYTTVHDMFNREVREMEEDMSDWPEWMIKEHIEHHAPTAQVCMEMQRRKQAQFVDYMMDNLLFQRNKRTKTVEINLKNHSAITRAQAALFRIQQMQSVHEKSAGMMI